MMNRVILLPVFAFFMYLADSACAQSAEEMIGKWKLESISVAGESTSLTETFGTEEIYQVYGEDQRFTGIVGDKETQGTWKLSKNKKKVIVDAGGQRAVFKFLEFKKDYIKYSSNIVGLGDILEYEKIE